MRKETVNDCVQSDGRVRTTCLGLSSLSSMYGLLVESLAEFIKCQYGEDKWEEIRRMAKVETTSFSTHQVYSETLIPKLAQKACEVLDVSSEDLMNRMGEHFVGFVGQYGYDRVLSVLGRHVRDFLNGLDNLHEYLKFSYPRMRPPSFFCENETSTGMTLHYRSKRRGYAHYTMGQINQVGRLFYNTDIEIQLIKEEVKFDSCHVTFQLKFDNQAFANQVNLNVIRSEHALALRGNILFEIFPFCMLFGSKMTVRFIGNSMMQVLPDIVGKSISSSFEIVRPIIEFNYESILARTNNIFELVTTKEAYHSVSAYHSKQKLAGLRSSMENLTGSDDEEDVMHLRLKGQMIYMESWKLILFLGTPVMPDLDSMVQTGLYINDLSMHDFSRDLMLAGTQQSVELKLALDQEQQKSKKLEESMKKLDEEMKRTDELLYQMIPMQVANRLRKGENPVDTCEVFKDTRHSFPQKIRFQEIYSWPKPMESINTLNNEYQI
ncbi:unnamed protein product, partial [Meganyctiphanes norvegica]